ncbi:hypothetical protein SAMN04487852_106135 [Prevotella sp. tf2-5]|nr:hypothetical protein SAMN04487852_106135 [Prevotella sp. tf2-5]
MASIMLVACGSQTEEDGLTLNSKFDGTWNIHESFERNSDGSIVYHAIPWGGLVGSMRERNLPVDWSKYESLSVEFTEPTTVGTQLMISNKLRVFGKPGITTVTCYFDGQDVSQVDEVAIQSADSSTLKIKRVYLTPGSTVWTSTPLWEGNCVFGNWENGFIVDKEKFLEAEPGDKLEFIYEADTSDPNVQYWQFKTIYNGTDKTLEGNADQLNEWGCCSVGESGVLRIRLTATDIKELRKYGMFVNGYYNNVSKVNLLKKGYTQKETY